MSYWTQFDTNELDQMYVCVEYDTNICDFEEILCENNTSLDQQEFCPKCSGSGCGYCLE